MEQLKSPEPLSFEGNVRNNWRHWIQRFRQYLTTTGATEKSEGRQCATLLTAAGEEAIECYSSFTFMAEGESPENRECLIKKIQDHGNVRNTEVFDRNRFFVITQEGEVDDQFITELTTKARPCELIPLERKTK